MSFVLFIIVILAVIIVGTVLTYYIFNKAGEKGVMKDAALRLEQNINDGYFGTPEDLSKYVGEEGVALTVLRPAGKIKIGDDIIDAISYNDFIGEGTKVKVLKYENAQLYVLRIN